MSTLSFEMLSLFHGNRRKLRLALRLVLFRVLAHTVRSRLVRQDTYIEIHTLGFIHPFNSTESVRVGLLFFFLRQISLDEFSGIQDSVLDSVSINDSLAHSLLGIIQSTLHLNVSTTLHVGERWSHWLVLTSE